MSAKRNGRIVVLMGAGASLDFNAPSTKTLTGEIASYLRAEYATRNPTVVQVYETIKEELEKYLRPPGEVNFEHIYHVAHELLKRPNIIDKGRVNEFRPLLQPFLKPIYDLDEDALRDVLTGMTKRIFSRMVEASKARPDVSSLGCFISSLRASHVTRIYTTNYDDFILQAAPDLYTGFPVPSDADPTPFELNRFHQKYDQDGVFHLHGSIHMGYPHPKLGTDINIGELRWYADPSIAMSYLNSGVSSSDRTMDGSTVLRSPVITGLDKLTSLQAVPMAHYYHAFARDLMEADLIYVIGSGLTDLHLNTWLHEARMRDNKPPIIFVDCWRRGYLEHADHENDRKEIEMFHSLGIRASSHSNGRLYKDHWTIAGDISSAVWDDGFKSFLEVPAELKEILAILRA